MRREPRRCPECDDAETPVSRRGFLKTAGLAGAALAVPIWRSAYVGAAETPTGAAAETTVKRLYDSLSAEQKKVIAFDWDYIDPARGLLRTRVANNWRITEPPIGGDFYTPQQKHLIRAVFEGIIHPDWHARIDKQLADDDGGFGTAQRIAIFGTPGTDTFEFVLTGRHMTLRCDGNSADHVAFGGPIFYGHAAQGFNEKPNHPGNVFWHQAVAANEVFKMLDGRQRDLALLKEEPAESAVGFQGPQGKFPGIPVAELSADQREALEKVLAKLVEPYRQPDRDEALACLETAGGIERCHLAFYQEGDIGSDGVWDVWRFEGPSFVWHFRGSPHVHVWVNIADSPAVKLNA